MYGNVKGLYQPLLSTTPDYHYFKTAINTIKKYTAIVLIAKRNITYTHTAIVYKQLFTV